MRREDAGASEKRALSRFQYRVLPMYANLPFGEQMKVFQRPPRNIRKIVVATNIAEASSPLSPFLTLCSVTVVLFFTTLI